MPKIFMFKGFNFLFYSNEHDGPHVHAKKAGAEVKVIFHEIDGDIWQAIKKVRGELKASDLKIIDDFIKAYRDDILQKWNTHYNNKQPVSCETITKIKKSRKKGSTQKESS